MSNFSGSTGSTSVAILSARLKSKRSCFILYSDAKDITRCLIHYISIIYQKLFLVYLCRDLLQIKILAQCSEIKELSHINMPCQIFIRQLNSRQCIESFLKLFLTCTFIFHIQQFNGCHLEFQVSQLRRHLCPELLKKFLRCN